MLRESDMPWKVYEKKLPALGLDIPLSNVRSPWKRLSSCEPSGLKEPLVFLQTPWGK